MRIWTIPLVMLMALLAGAAWAEELPVFYKGIRPLGMGGAFTAVADDENAMFYNPAGLNKIEALGGVDILNPYFEYSKNTLDFFKDLGDVEDAQTDTEQAQLAADLLEKWFGKHLHLRTGLFPSATFHNFGVGVLGQASFDGEVHNPLGPNTLNIRAGYDIALVVSGAYAFMDKKLQVGATGKFINRRFLDQEYSTLDLVQEDGIKTDDFEKGTGVGIDLGAIYNPPMFLDPSFGLTILNIADVDLGDAGKLEQQVNLGAAVHPPLGFGKLLVAFDIVDLTNQLGRDNDLAKRLHLGVEYKLPVILALRAGLNQGYPSYGVGVDLWILNLNYAYYIEEIGAYAGQLPDRRHIFQFSIGF